MITYAKKAGPGGANGGRAPEAASTVLLVRGLKGAMPSAFCTFERTNNSRARNMTFKNLVKRLARCIIDSDNVWKTIHKNGGLCVSDNNLGSKPPIVMGARFEETPSGKEKYRILKTCTYRACKYNEFGVGFSTCLAERGRFSKEMLELLENASPPD